MKTGLRLLSPAVILCVFLGGCIPAHNINNVNAQLSSLKHQTYLLKNDLEATKENDAKDLQTLRSQYASLKAEFKNVLEEMQGLRGELQSTAHLLQQHLKTYEKNRTAERQQIYEMNQALLARITKLEGYLGFETPAEPTAAPPGEKVAETDLPTAAPDSKAQSQTSTMENDLYKFAMQAFESGDFQAARDALTKLLETYPKSEICDNARFWIGETYYREKWYEKAILEYQKVIDTYPKGNKVPDALLKQGMAFHNINDNTNARLVFKKLIDKFPGTSAATIAKKKMSEL